MNQLNWYGDKVLTQLHELLTNRLEAVAIHLAGKVKENLSSSGVGHALRGFTRAGRRFRKGRRIYGAAHSKPGEFPLKQTGTTRSRYTWEIDKVNLVARVGTNYKIAKFLELGTSKMAARPHLRRTMMEEMGAMKNLIQSGRVPASP